MTSLSFVSRSNSNRLLVQALTNGSSSSSRNAMLSTLSSSSSTTARAFWSRYTMKTRQYGFLQALAAAPRKPIRINKQTFSSAGGSSGAVEDDLDAALDALLGSSASSPSRSSASGTTMKRTSAPASDNYFDGMESNQRGNNNNSFNRYDSRAGSAFEYRPGSSSQQSRQSSPTRPAQSMSRSGKPPLSIDPIHEPEGDINYRDVEVLSIDNPRWLDNRFDPEMINVLRRKGFTHFTPVQAEACDPILNGRDVICQSRTGTGKTLAFGLPAIMRIVNATLANGKRSSQGRMRAGRSPSMLVLCPTRELARQVSDELSMMISPFSLSSHVFHGGVSYDPQAAALRRGIDIVVGTPGRMIDHLNRGNLQLGECEIVALDEADEMLNMGFSEDVETILSHVGTDLSFKAQCLLFSATTPPWVAKLARQYQHNPLEVDTTGEEGGARVAKTVRHVAMQLPPGSSKLSMLEEIISYELSKQAQDDAPDEDDYTNDPIAAAAAQRKHTKRMNSRQAVYGKTIVFTETKRQADQIAMGGVFKTLTAEVIHGDVGQGRRDAILNSFRAGKYNVLVATDVAARGIDIKDVDLVVQLDPPRDTDSYVHRSGRTGRAGNKGVSVLLFDANQVSDILRIENELGHGFQFDLVGPPSSDASLEASSAATIAAYNEVPIGLAEIYADAAEDLLKDSNPVEVVSRFIALISRNSGELKSRSMITGELGQLTVEVSKEGDAVVSLSEVINCVGKLSRLSVEAGSPFNDSIGSIQPNPGTNSAVFDMAEDDARRLITFSKSADTGGLQFSTLKFLSIDRDRFMSNAYRGRGSRGGSNKGGGGNSRSGGNFGGFRGRYDNGMSSGRNTRNDFSNRRGGYDGRGRGGGYDQNSGRGGGYDRNSGRGGGYNSFEW